jgi:hypothetical protein
MRYNPPTKHSQMIKRKERRPQFMRCKVPSNYPHTIPPSQTCRMHLDKSVFVTFDHDLLAARQNNLVSHQEHDVLPHPSDASNWV